MESSSSSSGSGHVPGDCQLTSTQVEVLGLLRRLVHLVVSDTAIDIRNQQEFRVIIRRLCEEAPEAADALATTIQETSNSIDNSLQRGQDVVEKGTSQTTKRKHVSNKDLTYRPPRSAKTTAAETNIQGDSGLPDEGEIQVDCPVKHSAAHRTQSSVQNAGDIDLRDELVPKRQDAVDPRRTETEPYKNVKKSIKTTEATSAFNKVEGMQTSVLPRPLTPLAKADTAPVTPTKTINDTSTPTQTEEILRETMPTSLESISSSPRSGSVSSSLETTSLIGLVIEAVQVIHQFSKYPCAAPPGVHSRILQAHRNGHQDAIDAFRLDQWSDGSMWMRILEMGSTQNKKVTILNMIEYIGAWEWYDRQVDLATTAIRTKKNKLVDRKGAAMHVLNTMQSTHWGTAPPGRWIGGLGRVAVEQEGNAADLCPDVNTSITETDRRRQRKRISLQLSRGQRLSTKLVKALGLGILFSPKIWEYTKMNEEQLDILIRSIQADSRRMKLLQILGPQLEQLVHKGQPDLHGLYEALWREELVSQKELQDLRGTFALDSDPMPKDSLNNAVHGLIEDVSTRVLGKRKLRDVDTVTVNDMQVPCDIFDRLRRGEWLNDNTIMVAMNISDKPVFVKHAYSVPLDKVGKTRTTSPIERPFTAWARWINRLREKTRNGFGNMVPLVYFCPLNHYGNHFTLLEINDQEKIIRHYDSMADQTTMDGRLKLTRVAQLVQEEFADLGYAYREAPTPQQTDGWSCGIRVVWNFSRLSNGLPIGGWDTILDPERMKMELVEGLLACVEANAMWNCSDSTISHQTDCEEMLGKGSRKSRRLGLLKESGYGR